MAKAAAGAKKKKWSKGKVKDKAQNAVYVDKPTYDRIYKEVPTFKMVSQSVLIDRLKVNGSVARLIINALTNEGYLKPVVRNHGQYLYTRTGKEVE